MGVTIKDIAKMADVSIATVSRVINNKNGGVSDETRERILQIMKELRYSPNRIARGLVTKKTNILGLILPDITNPFFPYLVRGVEDTASQYGYNIILCNSDNNPSKEGTYISILKENNVDGIICTSVLGIKDEDFANSGQKKIPFVFLDRSFNMTNAPVVYTDGIMGMHDIVSYVIANGHKRIACIFGPKNNSSTEQRMKGYLSALGEAGIDFDAALIREGDYRISGGYDCTLDLLDSGCAFTALVCANDLMAIGALQAMESKNIKVPDDISITGYDDIYVAGITSPKLTTVAQPIYEMGCYAVEQLIKLINGEPIKDKDIVLKPKLVIRQSVGKRSDRLENSGHR